MTGETPRVAESISPAVRERADLFGSADNSPAHMQPGEGGDALPHFCPTLTIDTESDPGSWAQHFTDTASMRGAL